MPGVRERRWLRPLGLFAVALTLSLGQPSIVAAVTLGLLILLAPGGGFFPSVAAAVALWVVFAGEPSGAVWYLERGWAIMVGGWFAALVMLWPTGTFLMVGLSAVAGAVASLGVLLIWLGGVESVEGFMRERIRIGMEAARPLIERTLGLEPGGGTEMAAAMGRIHEVLYPGLMALSALASLGAAWWVHRRLTRGSQDGLGGLREFRFPDPLIWILIVGLALMFAAEWSAGWGRVGTNLVAFMGGLYILRGAGVLLSLVGGLSFLGGLGVAVGFVFVGPFMLAGAMVVGVGDSWFDLRARMTRGDDGGAG